ncbi:MAG: hypothetical protein WAZ98_14105 [Cyclobacteriaceae bacterium]
MSVRNYRKLFIGAAVVFFGLLFYASYDIATRTTFPGSKPQLKEWIEKVYLKSDTVNPDSGRAVSEKERAP